MHTFIKDEKTLLKKAFIVWSVPVVLQVKNLERMDLSDEEKLELTIDILKITQGMYKYTKCTFLWNLVSLYNSYIEGYL